MSNYSIEGFWKNRLTSRIAASAKLVPGWSYQSQGLDTFTEAPLRLSDEFGDMGEAESSPVLIVSAAGAVGKSTLARQVAFETDSVYVDLAKAEPVGANTLSGGLVKSGLYESWNDGSTTILIDGLDEARMRVTQQAFEAFLADVLQVSSGRSISTVLFGRTGAAQDAWLVLADEGTDVPVLEIDYFDRDTSLEFAEAWLRTLRPNSQHRAVERQALELLLDQLRGHTESDGDRFAGYAPVIQAVAERVGSEGNPSELVSEMKQGEELVTLQSIVNAILDRERQKLRALPFEDRTLVHRLYAPTEQLDRLVSRVFGSAQPDLPPMGPTDAETYSNALETWVDEHPFLDGTGGPSSSVFDAAITARALDTVAAEDLALSRELGRGAAANPFLTEFYAPRSNNSEPVYLPPEHIGIAYASLRARLSLGDSATLLVEGVEEAEDKEAARADVEVTLARRESERPRVLTYRTDQRGAVCLGSHVADVDAVVPKARVEIGPGPEAVLVAPINIQCAELSISTAKVIVEGSSGSEVNAVHLEAESYDGANITSLPSLRGEASLSVIWPSAKTYPWTMFATERPESVDPRVDEGLRRLRRFVTAFRSHGRGNLGRYKHKIEHERMTKGAGRAVLSRMIEEGILSLQGSQYLLGPERLASQAGTNYGDCMAYQFGPETIAFVQRALNE